MNKNDKILLLLVFIISSIMIIISIVSKQEGGQALIYHNHQIIQTIDLNIDNTYQVKGDLGTVKVEVKDRKIRVIEENSPYHLCSKQGYISSSNETIICMPNRIMIEIIGHSSIDTQVK